MITVSGLPPRRHSPIGREDADERFRSSRKCGHIYHGILPSLYEQKVSPSKRPFQLPAHPFLLIWTQFGIVKDIRNSGICRSLDEFDHRPVGEGDLSE